MSAKIKDYIPVVESGYRDPSIFSRYGSIYC